MSSATPTAWQRSAPAITLALLAPIIAEVLFGGTRASFLFALIPEIGIWGCGALIIRYVARLRGLGWISMLLFSLALAVAEECLIQQTSLAPLVGLAKHAYGRVWGVNWVYFLWALGYESVWVVLLPVQITELIFPEQRREPWLSRGGLARSSIFFGLASFVAWYSWTQQARTKVFHMPPYHPPTMSVLLAVATILLLIMAALRLPRPSAPQQVQRAPEPWFVGLVAFILGLPWSAFVLLGYGEEPRLVFTIPLIAGVVWAAIAFVLIARWSSSSAWSDSHRFALVFGGVSACMLGGFVVFQVGGALPIDWIGKIVANIVALILLFVLARRIHHRASAALS